MPKYSPSNHQNKIKFYRKAAGMYQDELATAAGISRSMLYQYETVAYQGVIRHDVQVAIATALHKTVDEVFPEPSAQASEPTTISRRGLLTTGAMATVGIGSTMFFNPIGTPHKQLSNDDIQILADANFSTWELFDAAQSDSAVDYVSAVAIGKVTTLGQLAQMNLVPSQKNKILNLLADAYMIVGRINSEVENYRTSDQCFKQAEAIARETGDADLLAAIYQRYGFNMLEQERYSQALAYARQGLEETKGATTTLQAEVAYFAAEAMARSGDYTMAFKTLYDARNRVTTDEPEFWYGKLRNSRTTGLSREIVISTLAQKNRQAIDIAARAIEQKKKDEPDNIRWLSRIQIHHANALWQDADVQQSISVATEALSNARHVGSTRNEAAIEQLHQRMLLSRYKGDQNVRDLGQLLAI